jgi:competence protein ComEC
VRDAGVLVLDGDVGDAGSPIEARGWLLPLRDDTFDLARARLGANAYFDVATLHLSRPDAPLLAAAALIKSGLLRATSRLDKPQASLLQGLTIGDTEGFDDQTLESFRRAGLSHLLAVSGENVAIVLGAIAVGARALGLRLRLALAVIGLVLFVVVVGPEPSVLRAAIMGAIGLAALAFGRKAEPLHALGLALIVLIALRPGMVYSVALQLSAAATAGIVLWSASLAHRFGRVLPRTLALGLSATLSAQSAVAPVLIATFGQVSVVGPLSNLLALPAVAPATIIGLVAGVAGIVNGSVGALLARCAAPFAAWILWVARVFGSARGAAVDLPNWTAWLAALPVTAGAIRTLRGHSAS